MEKIMLNLNSLATMLCTCDLYAYDEAALTSDEWLEVEKKFKSSWVKWSRQSFWVK